MKKEVVGGSRIYRPDFRKNYIWLWSLFLPLSLICFLFGGTLALGLFWSDISDFLTFLVFLIPVVLLLSTGWVLMWGFLVAIKERIIFTDEYILCQYPHYLLFLTKEVKVPKKSINRLAFGKIALSYLDPGFLKSEQAKLIPGPLGVEVGYKEGDKDRRVTLSAYHDPNYFAEFKRLIREQKLMQTQLKFIFRK